MGTHAPVASHGTKCYYILFLDTYKNKKIAGICLHLHTHFVLFFCLTLHKLSSDSFSKHCGWLKDVKETLDASFNMSWMKEAKEGCLPRILAFTGTSVYLQLAMWHLNRGGRACVEKKWACQMKPRFEACVVIVKIT